MQVWILVDFNLSVTKTGRQTIKFTCNSPPNFPAIRLVVSRSSIHHHGFTELLEDNQQVCQWSREPLHTHRLHRMIGLIHTNCQCMFQSQEKRRASFSYRYTLNKCQARPYGRANPSIIVNSNCSPSVTGIWYPHTLSTASLMNRYPVVVNHHAGRQLSQCFCTLLF